ncbi:ABC transporter ATP-binding protein [soil metagenome]
MGTAWHGGAVSCGVTKILPSSKVRFREYVQGIARRKGAQAGERSVGTGSGGVLDGNARASERGPAGAEKKTDWTQTPEKGGKRRAQRSFAELLRAFLPLLREHWGKCATAVGTVLVTALLGLLTPLGAKITLDYVIAPTPAKLAQLEAHGYGTDASSRIALGWWVALATFGLALMASAVGTVGRYQMTRLNKLVQARVRRDVFEHMSRLPLHRLSALKSGGVASILRDDAGIVGEMLFSVLYNPLRAVVTLAGGLIAMAILDWRMLVGGIALIPIVWVTHRTWIGRIRPVFGAIKSTRTSTDAQATEAFAGMRIVRAFDRRRGETVRFTKSNQLMTRQEMLVWWWSRAIESAWMILIPAATAVGLAYGGGQVIAGRLSVGDIGAFLTYLGMILGPLELLVGTASSLQNGLAGWDRVLDVMHEEPEFAGSGGAGRNPAYLEGAARAVAPLSVSDTDGMPASLPVNGPVRPHQVDKGNVRGDVALRGVSFTYPGQTEPVLHEVSVEAAAGTTVALVGASGSGKTTLCNLVARFFDPSVGVVTLDGVDLKTIDVESYRRLLGIVEQEVFLFDGTVADNIAYADRGASMTRIENAARAANAEEFIVGLEQGYETIIGERGVRLSGGQKQRIAIARALLAEPKILILDEATSSLDTKSERLIQGSLLELMRGRTCFVIAHRLSTIRSADLIVVIEKGRVAETGTHDELVERRGQYFEMLQVQLHTARDYASL